MRISMEQLLIQLSGYPKEKLQKLTIFGVLCGGVEMQISFMTCIWDALLEVWYYPWCHLETWNLVHLDLKSIQKTLKMIFLAGKDLEKMIISKPKRKQEAFLCSWFPPMPLKFPKGRKHHEQNTPKNFEDNYLITPVRYQESSVLDQSMILNQTDLDFSLLSIESPSETDEIESPLKQKTKQRKPVKPKKRGTNKRENRCEPDNNK